MTENPSSNDKTYSSLEEKLIKKYKNAVRDNNLAVLSNIGETDKTRKVSRKILIDKTYRYAQVLGKVLYEDCNISINDIQDYAIQAKEEANNIMFQK
jgi:hypothetical protein